MSWLEKDILHLASSTAMIKDNLPESTPTTALLGVPKDDLTTNDCICVNSGLVPSMPAKKEVPDKSISSLFINKEQQFLDLMTSFQKLQFHRLVRTDF
jgi:hypothetical protein